MSNRTNIEAMNAELAGVQCQIDQLSSVMQRRSISPSVSREDFNTLIETVEALASTIETMAGMIEGISESVGDIEAELETAGFEAKEDA